MASRNWTCPHCNRPQTLTKGQEYEAQHHIPLQIHKFSEAGIQIFAQACANPECQEITVSATLTVGELALGPQGFRVYRAKRPLSAHKLRPEASYKPQPEFIPTGIRQDYYEACRIRELSPKASATLARRCLQGMIRDFCNIRKDRLIDEIKELKSQVDFGNGPRGVQPETLEAIDHVRRLGNIGAHMEKDVNAIIDIDEGEAQTLIQLLELLFDEWYVEREIRKNRLAKIEAISVEKDQAKKEARSAAGKK